ncbi:flagellar motor switch protein FliM [Caloranaerobacter azorensis]|uniref:Flagellar motor switch protein FliM n=2 Tax=Caloranaerobacter azorensis TaxID=116090 RepID=A0A1M5RLU1_9FIRM|nr:flagellar motor switch protein FliM [Caloranaerobacter azorensis]QIB26185.1 flagellar motor switch protein FliM [Caloranaerobacter azorensis]SHH27175.1 flagellar motor switch protein FliM [Caloranaerobacter azorensis DSM 13643]
MSEVLSQSEIDALLKALTSGEVDVKEIKEEAKEKKVRKYDFRNPQKIAKDQMRTLGIIHDKLARLLQTFLSGYLRAPVNVEVLTIDQYVFSEFSNAISNPAFLSIINFNPLSGQIILDISPNIAYAVIDRLLGGNGSSVELNRSFTEIELVLLKQVFCRIQDIITQAWDNILDLKPSLEKIETNSQFIQIVSPSETIVLITLNVKIGETEGMANICIPHLTIEPILNKLSTKLWYSTNSKDIDSTEIDVVKKRIRKVKVPLIAEIGSTLITVKDLLDLRVGDVIKLNRTTDSELEIKVGSKTKFYGVPGIKNNKIAVKITRVKKDGEDIDDE